MAIEKNILNKIDYVRDMWINYNWKLISKLLQYKNYVLKSIL